RPCASRAPFLVEHPAPTWAQTRTRLLNPPSHCSASLRLLLYRTPLLAHEISEPWFALRSTIRGRRRKFAGVARFRAHSASQRAVAEIHSRSSISSQMDSVKRQANSTYMPIIATSNVWARCLLNTLDVPVTVLVRRP